MGDDSGFLFARAGARLALFLCVDTRFNGAAYVLYSLFSRHLLRDLAPTRAELDGIGTSVVDHLKFKHPTGDAAKRYNVLQKLAYMSVIFVLVPLLIICGWALSPWLNSIIPGWVDILGGRQSARTIHFLAAWLLFLFVAVHVFEVIVSGFWNHMRSMITGRYRTSRRHAMPVDKSGAASLQALRVRRARWRCPGAIDCHRPSGSRKYCGPANH